jgi:ribosomal protein S18 acetylase RimI-like enzyme
MQTITFRDILRDSDRVVVQTIVESTGFFRADEVAVAVELVDERLSKGPASGYHFVFAELQDVVAGYACYGPIACTVASYDLYWIAVDPQHQRQGIGCELMSQVEHRIAAAGGSRIYIDTSGKAQYESTRAFYERSGFHREAVLEDFYAPGDDRVIYVKTISREWCNLLQSRGAAH